MEKLIDYVAVDTTICFHPPKANRKSWWHRRTSRPAPPPTQTRTQTSFVPRAPRFVPRTRESLQLRRFKTLKINLRIHHWFATGKHLAR